ncbi:MAG: hypothetical protein CM15mP74_15100 [Halieaceae bacterium]|nr:MAG: hypothetical protein CM15mP74_15100 [Halieaceae bacterium]
MSYWSSPAKSRGCPAVIPRGRGPRPDGAVGIDVIDERWMALGGISGKHLNLLERQLQNLRRIVTSPDDDTPQGLLPF